MTENTSAVDTSSRAFETIANSLQNGVQTGGLDSSGAGTLVYFVIHACLIIWGRLSRRLRRSAATRGLLEVHLEWLIQFGGPCKKTIPLFLTMSSDKISCIFALTSS